MLEEFRKHKYHYALLIFIQSLLLTIFVATRDQLLQHIAAVCIGVFYFLWGVIVHTGTLLTVRLMLEYAVIGFLGSVILIVLIGSV